MTNDKNCLWKYIIVHYIWQKSNKVHSDCLYVCSPLSLLTSWIFFGLTVTHFACMVHRLLSSIKSKKNLNINNNLCTKCSHQISIHHYTNNIHSMLSSTKYASAASCKHLTTFACHLITDFLSSPISHSLKNK